MAQNQGKKESEGAYYAVDGATYTCQYSAAPAQIVVTSHRKVLVQGKPVVTENDVTFASPTAPFVTCLQNQNNPPTCLYSNGQWNKKTMINHGKMVATEKSELTCPVFNGKITCLNHGQLTLSSFENDNDEKGIEATESQDEPIIYLDSQTHTPTKEKRSVNAIAVSETIVRKKHDVTLIAYKTKDKKAVQTIPIHWAVMMVEEKEEEIKATKNSKAKVEKVKRLKSLSIYKFARPNFTLTLHKEGTYIIEGMGGEATLNKYLNLKRDENISGKVPSYKNCSAQIVVPPNNSITEIKSSHPFIDGIYYVKQGETISINVKTLLKHEEEYEQITCDIRHATGAIVDPNEYSFDNTNLCLTIKPINAETDYIVNFGLLEKSDSLEDDLKLVSSKEVKVHSYNEAVLRCAKLIDDDTTTTENITLRRPGDIVLFSIEKKGDDNSSQDWRLDKVSWEIKLDNKVIENVNNYHPLNYTLRQEGTYTITADLRNTLLSNGGKEGAGLTDKEKKGACNQRFISHTIKVSHNHITKIKVTNSKKGKFYVGDKYPLDFEYLFGTETEYDDKLGIDVTCDSEYGSFIRGIASYYIFKPTKEGYVTLTATHRGHRETCTIKVDLSDVALWEFIDAKGNTIEDIGLNMKFGLQGRIPAWGLPEGASEKERFINIALHCRRRRLKTTYKVKLEENGQFLLEGIDVNKNIFEEAEYMAIDTKGDTLAIAFVVYNVPNSKIKNFSLSKDGGFFYNRLNPDKKTLSQVVLIVKKKFIINGFFATSDNKPLYDIVRYGDTVRIHIRMLNAPNSKEEMKKFHLRIYENKIFNDPVVYDKCGLELDSTGCMDIEIPTTEGMLSEEYHKNDLRPRLFYFYILKDCYLYYSKEYTYPSSPGDLYNYNVELAAKRLEEGKASDDNKKESLSYCEQLKLMKPAEDEKFISVYNCMAATIVKKTSYSSRSDDDAESYCPRCTEEAKELAKRLKEIYPKNNDKDLLTVAETYCELQYTFSMDSCWAKAVFFSMAYLETGSILSAKDESFDYSRAVLIKKHGAKIPEEGPKRDEFLRVFARKENSKVPQPFEVRRALANKLYARPKNDLGNRVEVEDPNDPNNVTKEPTYNDGYNFRGRGLVQITGRSAYTDIQTILQSIGFRDPIDSSEPFNITDNSNFEKVSTSLRVATATAMAFFKWKNANIRKLCDGFIKKSDIRFDCSGDDTDMRGLDPVIWKMGKDVTTSMSLNIKDANGKDLKIDLGTNHRGKKLVFKNLAYKAFDLENCQFGDMDKEGTGLMTYHIYSNGNVVKHIPKNISDSTIYRYVYHTKNASYEVCRRKIFKSQYFTNCIKGTNVPESDEKDLKVIHTYRGNKGINGKEIGAHYASTKDQKFDYVIVYPKTITIKNNRKTNIAKYTSDQKEVEIVRIDTITQAGTNEEQKVLDTDSGSLCLYRENEVFIAYHVDIIGTERCYSNPTVFAFFIGMLARYGERKLDEVKKHFKDELNKDPKDTRKVYSYTEDYAIAPIENKKKITIGRHGSGNAEIMGTGFPSVSHKNGMAFDFAYGSKEDDEFLIKLAKEYGFSCILRGPSYPRDGAKKDDNHDSHLHIGTPKYKDYYKDDNGNYVAKIKEVTVEPSKEETWDLPFYKIIKEE